MNTQVLALLVTGVSVMGALGIAALAIMIMATFAWRGTGKQQMAVGDAQVDRGSIVRMGPYLFACLPLRGAGRWAKDMRNEYDTIGQRVGEDAAYFWMVEKKRAPALAMA